MTERQKRLMRLTELRNRQHERAVAELLAARNDLHTAMESIEHGVVSARIARLNRNAALADAEREGWLLACIDAEIAVTQIQRSVIHRQEAEQKVTIAAEREEETRRELRQMERTVERLRQDERLLSARKEQQQLDEYARLLRIRSSKQTPALEQT